MRDKGQPIDPTLRRTFPGASSLPLLQAPQMRVGPWGEGGVFLQIDAPGHPLHGQVLQFTRAMALTLIHDMKRVALREGAGDLITL
jgi:hypothetical protein